VRAVIIAAGKGSRFQDITNHTPKPLISLLGLSLIERIILTAKQASIKDFTIIIGYLGEKIKEKLGDGKKYGVKITYIENDEWEKENGVSLIKAKEKIKEDFILLMADHIFDSRIIKAMTKCKKQSTIILAVDRRKPRTEDTKVLEENGKIIAIGKKIKKSNCVDAGIFLCSPKIFNYMEEALKEGKTKLADGVLKAAENNDAEIFDITTIEKYASKMRKDIDPWWIDIDTKNDLSKAKEIIIANASKNPSDALATYVHKPIENRIVAHIANYNITPNQITIIVNILAYTAAILFFIGQLLPASILTFVVGLIDGLDGKLARVKLMTSKIGSMEHSFDLLFEFSWFIAIAGYTYNTSGEAIALLICALIILFISFYRHVYDQFRKTMEKSIDDSGNFERKFKRIAGRRNLYNIEILIGVILTYLTNTYTLIYTLTAILIHAIITAITYSACAIKHLKNAE